MWAAVRAQDILNKNPEPNIKTGWLSRYARMVTSANLGAVLK